MEAEKKNQKKLTVAIRAARPEDLAAMRHICLATSTEQAREKKALGDAFLLAFCDYYARAETEHCFVAVNEKDVPIGYILCGNGSADLYEGYSQERLDRRGRRRDSPGSDL